MHQKYELELRVACALLNQTFQFWLVSFNLPFHIIFLYLSSLSKVTSHFLNQKEKEKKL